VKKNNARDSPLTEKIEISGNYNTVVLAVLVAAMVMVSVMMVSVVFPVSGCNSDVGG
jgi:hypothetical protein